MPEVTSVEKEGHIRHLFKIQPGEKVMLCRCYKSSTFPFCDATHRHTPDHFGPVIIEVAQKEEDKPDQAG